ncbi:hypothetical protein CgunFtcFv8_018208 [Champsocephalus gunnari]|uniref:Uncharacterized protein n=1 Tax=Champsocephalus gunnari TaxID=52237 RepID=A0AAN8HWD3_CHAGU|nr:hypothetical protein CgunFtcFv8_018208 [Champsocephalus gunnari]
MYTPQILEERKHQSSSTRRGRTYPTGRTMRSRGEVLRAGLAVTDGRRWGGNTYVALAASPGETEEGRQLDSRSNWRDRGMQ